MINRARVAQIIEERFEAGGDAVLQDLEDAGYAVVRQGHVPDLEPLHDVQQRLRRLANYGGKTQHDPAAAGAAATLLFQLRELACLVLDIDETDRDTDADED